ncbi:MAG: VCBS repeat-containing protein [Bacteroidota bacterium]
MAFLLRVKILLMLPLLFITACNHEDDSEYIFHELSPDRTNITFSNTIESSDSLNVQSDHFIYNGAGVATGDINNDGQPDIFFSGNMVPSRLYLNEGDMNFRDITDQSGINTDKRVTGVSMVDINHDGYLDIYLSVSGTPWSEPDQRRNLLYLNNGDNSFTESAAEYQVDDPGFTTHAVFFDYNGNGLLDLFLLGNSPEEFGRGDTGGGFRGAKEPIEYGTDQLYRNDGDGTFTNVSDEAGILNRLGYGLGVVVSDLNNDGWPDLYISNDITPNDVLYINNGDGTFDDKAADYLMHTSFAGMGMDIADFSNNGWPDIIQTDMMPEILADQKRMSGSTTYSTYQRLRQQGYFPHYNTNTLQLNRGVTKEGDIIFSEIGRMAGVSYTDWSWAALFADFDNDGHKDLFISNGYPKAVNDFDYLSDMFRARQSGNEEEVQQEELRILENLHSYRVSNYVFQNNSDLTFTNKTRQWGLHQPNFSYGAAYADLNNNGRLDLVISNINDTAQIFENRGNRDQQSNFLQISLESETSNRRGLGAKLTLTQNGEKQYIQHTPYRGYMSTVDDRIHFGLGPGGGLIDSLEITWPDGTYELLTDVEPNQHLALDHEDASQSDRVEHSPNNKQETLFTPVPLGNNDELKHRETRYNDFSIQAMLPYQISKENVPVAVGDINGNGLDDIYIGGLADVAGKLYIQQEDGQFVESNKEQPWEDHSNYEDWGAQFFDANGNGLQDLYVSSGSFRLSGISELLQDRLYINQGDGLFIHDPDALPEIRTSTATIEAGDFTGDGQPDLFIGGRVAPRSYPNPVRSYLLENDGGRFTDITSNAAQDLITPGGLVTDAVWIDYDGDQNLDLVTVGEWMPVQFYQNDGEKLNNVTESMDLPPMRGWWWSIEKGDLNNDGHPDLVAGNQGLNFSFRTSDENKFGLYASDFSDGWDTDLVFVQEINGIEYPYFGLAKMGNTIDRMNYQYDSFEAFSNEPLRNIFTSEELEGSLHYQSDTFASVKLLNNGNGTFSVGELPNEAQISPIKSIIVHDFNKDEFNDLLIAGNMFQTDPNIPRADAGKGLLLSGDEEGNLEPVPIHQSGFYAPKDVKYITLIETAEGKAVLIANHNEELQLFRLTSP